MINTVMIVIITEGKKGMHYSFIVIQPSLERPTRRWEDNIKMHIKNIM
jgi:hypothetical protein